MKEVNRDIIRACAEKFLEGRPECHGLAHALNVVRYTGVIGQSSGFDLHEDRVFAIAILHDAWDHKFVTSQEEAKVEAHKQLMLAGFSEYEADLIINEIDLISYSKGSKPVTFEGLVVQDADRLTALGALGVARCLTYSATHGKTLEEAIEHMKVKLLSLKDIMNTAEGTRLANMLTCHIETFITGYEMETGK